MSPIVIFRVVKGNLSYCQRQPFAMRKVRKITVVRYKKMAKGNDLRCFLVIVILSYNANALVYSEITNGKIHAIFGSLSSQYCFCMKYGGQKDSEFSNSYIWFVVSIL